MTKFKKSIATLSLMILMVSNVPTDIVSASTPTDNSNLEVFTATYDMSASTFSSNSSTKSASGNMGLFLNAGASGTSSEASFNFNLPSNAKVTKIQITPGSVSTSGKGAILPQRVNITSPDGNKNTLSWNHNSMTSTSQFFYDNADGIWRVSFYGTNISGWDFAASTYSSPKMTITYVLA